MVTKEINELPIARVKGEKAKAFVQLLKLRLSLLVSFSAVFGFAMASGTWGWGLFWIGFGGLLVTGASNVLNQILEREYDAQMKRTSQRPLPTGVLSDLEALAYALVLAVVGVGIIGYFFNLPAALLSIIGLLVYAFVYTPLKRITPFCVFVGAIPGGLPPLIGWVAFTGSIGPEGLLLFAFQFFWQFPHFWAIAWMLDDDYQRAGFVMLPSSKGKTKFSVQMILIYTLCLVPLVYFAWETGIVGLGGTIALVVLGLAFSWPAFRLFRTLEGKYAKQLMFASFLYLPLIQLAFLLG
ncbi:MAG: protoheme IX farnesyltransferase [Chloroflexi bacterium AL-W]|nr:protoheme IX farnesyltransferase [Chloroflexi bacterium AL-W]